MSGEKNWYAVHTYSGYENKVKANLEARLESMNMQDQIFRVIIPEEEETTVKDGKRKTAMKKTFPAPGVTGFVGSQGAGSKPNPLLSNSTKSRNCNM